MNRSAALRVVGGTDTPAAPVARTELWKDAPWTSRLAWCLTASLLLHALPVTAWLGMKAAAPPPPRNEQLAVELFGMVSTRQVEERHEGQEQAQQPQEAAPPAPVTPPAPTPMPAPEKLPEPEPEMATQEAESPVLVEKPQEETPPPQEQQASPTTESVTADQADAMVQGAEDQQVQQTVATEVSEETLMRMYLAELRKAIQKNLSYPAEARRKGQQGSPKIRFVLTTSGAIQPGSLQVDISSGHPLLDEAALRAARESAPLPPPPREMDVKIKLSFLLE